MTMNCATPEISPAPASLLARLLQILQTVTYKQMVLPDVDGQELDEPILLDSGLVRTPPMLFAASNPPLL